MNYKEITVTFKNGFERKFGDGEWNDYMFSGNAVQIVREGIIIAIYNFDEIYSVELA